MGLITSSFPFIVGTVCGIYIAQNYDVPNIKKVFNDAFSKAKHVEEKYRKPKRGDWCRLIGLAKYEKDRFSIFLAVQPIFPLAKLLGFAEVVQSRVL